METPTAIILQFLVVSLDPCVGINCQRTRELRWHVPRMCWSAWTSPHVEPTSHPRRANPPDITCDTTHLSITSMDIGCCFFAFASSTLLMWHIKPISGPTKVLAQLGLKLRVTLSEHRSHNVILSRDTFNLFSCEEKTWKQPTGSILSKTCCFCSLSQFQCL